MACVRITIYFENAVQFFDPTERVPIKHVGLEVLIAINSKFNFLNGGMIYSFTRNVLRLNFPSLMVITCLLLLNIFLRMLYQIL
jgi:hypothetical protein